MGYTSLAALPLVGGTLGLATPDPVSRRALEFAAKGVRPYPGMPSTVNSCYNGRLKSRAFRPVQLDLAIPDLVEAES